MRPDPLADLKIASDGNVAGAVWQQLSNLGHAAMHSGAEALVKRHAVSSGLQNQGVGFATRNLAALGPALGAGARGFHAAGGVPGLATAGALGLTGLGAKTLIEHIGNLFAGEHAADPEPSYTHNPYAGMF